MTILNGLWWGVSRGFLAGFFPLLSQLALGDFFLQEMRQGNKKTAYAVSVAWATSLWPVVAVLFL
jgi:hypothetical protein